MTALTIAVHPGRILRDEYLEPLGVSPIQLSRHLGVPRTRIERLVREETSLSLDTAKRLAAAFETSVAFWMNMQTNFDIAGAHPANDISPLRTTG